MSTYMTPISTDVYLQSSLTITYLLPVPLPSVLIFMYSNSLTCEIYGKCNLISGFEEYGSKYKVTVVGVKREIGLNFHY